MANQEWLNAKEASSGVEVRVWGRRGVDSRLDIERELGVTFGEQIASFVETVGNASIVPYMVVIAGSDDGAMSAITETRTCRATAREMPMHLVKIMDDEAGGSYFYNAKSGEVEVFESTPLNTNSNSRLRRFEDFDSFLSWLFQEAKLQSEDSRFAF